MPETFRISETIARPAADIFAALTQPGELERYFVSAANASPLSARELIWRFEGQSPLHLQVSALRLDQVLEFRWSSPEHQEPVQIRFELSEGAGGTTISICEAGWQNGELARRESYKHCMLWQRMLLNLKAYLQFGIDLRQKGR